MRHRACIAFALLVGFATAATGAPRVVPLRVVPLKVVNVNAPAVYCVFDTTCNIAHFQTSAIFSLPGAQGVGFLHSRTFSGATGSPAAGVTAYLYRIDLSQMHANIAGVLALEVDFGPLTKLDYNP